MQRSSPFPPEAPDAVGGNAYRDWAVVRLEQWGWPVESTLILPEPDHTVPARVEAAREQGVERIVCGFLPDEVDWAGDANPGALQYFLDVFRFVPWLMADVPGKGAPRAGPQQILLLREEPAEAARDTGSGRLAEALSMWSGLPVSLATVEDLTGVGGSEQLLRSWAVVHESRAWNLGFGIDHAAAAAGVRCMHLGGPEYSPLRYSLFGNSVRRSESAESLGLRDLLAEPARVSAAPGDWFGSRESAGRWRSLWVNETEPGLRVQAAEGATDTGGASRWSARWVGWMGLLGAARHAAFPAEAVQEAHREVARRVWADDRAGSQARATEAAVMRFVRLCPGWIRTFRAVSGRSPRADVLVRRWSLGAIERGGADGGGIAVLQAGREAWSASDAECAAAAGLLKIAQGESEGLRQLAGHPFPPPWRPIAVDAALAFLGSDGVDHARGDALLDGMQVALGAAAPLLRFAHALRSGDLESCRRMWRDRYPKSGLGTAGGGAAVVRAALPDREAWAQWLRERAIGKDDQAWGEVTHLIARWFQRRVWALWRPDPDAGVRREHRAALRLLRQCVRAHPDRPVDWHRLATLEAFDLDALAAGAAIERFAALTGNAGDLPAIVALALAWRDRGHDAIAVLERWSTSGTTKPIVFFIRALTWQTCGRLDRAEIEIEALPAWPDALSAAQRDAGLVWLAALLGRSALGSLARRLRVAALAAVPPSQDLLDHLPAPAHGLSPAWERLAVQSLTRAERAS